MKTGSEKGKRKKVKKNFKKYIAPWTQKDTEALEDRAKLREIETIISADLLKLLVL